MDEKVNLVKQDGEEIVIYLREYCEGDEKELISCIQDEYGETYFRNAFYQPEYIRKQEAEGNMHFLIAQEITGEVAGMLVLKYFFPEESMCEIASQIFRKKYRKLGLSMPFFLYGIKLACMQSYSSLYCLPVLFHSITQKQMTRMSFFATGVIMNVFDMNEITHSHHNGRNTKHSQGIQVRKMQKQDAGKLFIPVEHRKFCEKIYEKLKINYQFEKETEAEKMPIKSIVTYYNDENQNSLEIRIQKVGRDLDECIRGIHSKFPLKGRQTANIFLNCNDMFAISAYKCLVHIGYFFTGLRPLCGEKEYMVLHHPGEIICFWEDYVVNNEFASILNYIKADVEKHK